MLLSILQFVHQSYLDDICIVILHIPIVRKYLNVFIPFLTTFEVLSFWLVRKYLNVVIPVFTTF